MANKTYVTETRKRNERVLERHLYPCWAFSNMLNGLVNLPPSLPIIAKKGAKAKSYTITRKSCNKTFQKKSKEILLIESTDKVSIFGQK